MATTNQVRIIGGVHRGRKLRFASLPGLRPTGDRVRETLFNWLAPMIEGAHCLDLFAGSGALGLEAASRGAGRVLMLDRSPKVVAQLRENIALMRLDQTRALQADAVKWLQGEPEPFDLVFLDPPFADNLLDKLLPRLVGGGWLKPAGLIYLEADARTGLPRLPAELAVAKEKRQGEVVFALAASATPDG
jgi:16S rRNA (guanine966-N2)-methyltransferase